MIRLQQLLSVTAFALTLTPLVATAAPFFTPHNKLVREINRTYGTTFPQGDQARMAHHQTRTVRIANHRSAL
jgi:hypothetical protein